MSDHEVDAGRRRFLTASTTLVGGTGAVVALWPFVASMAPSADARTAGAPVEVDVSRMEWGQKIDLIWRKQPIWIIRRPPEMLETLAGEPDYLRDPHSQKSQQPAFAQNSHRSLRKEYLVLVGICTHLGCNPMYRPDAAPEDLGPEWPGGFFCACHGSRFDMAGRVYANVPANANLKVPPYRFLSDTRILIGEMSEDEETSA